MPLPRATADDTVEAVLIGDSVMHGMAGSGGAEARSRLLARHTFLLDSAPCRRLTTPGCRISGVPTAPLDALDVLRQRAGQYTRAVVVAVGYNDVIHPPSQFAADVDAIVGEVASHGTSAVLWLTYREKSDFAPQYAEYNRILREKALTIPQLRIVDWNERAATLPAGSFASDGVHLGRGAANAMADLIAEALDALPHVGSAAGSGVTAIPTAVPPPVPAGHVSPLRCYADTWVGLNAPPPTTQVAQDFWGGVHTLDVPIRLVDTRTGKGKLGPHRVLPVPVVGTGAVPPTATAAIVTITSVEPCARGYISAFPCGNGLPTTAVLNANAETIVTNSAIVMLGGGSICLFNNEPTDIVVDLTGWIGPDGAGTVSVQPARLVDTRAGEAQVLPVPQTRLPARTGLTIDLTPVADVDAATPSITFNLTAVNPAAPGFLTVLPGPCAGQTLPPSTASLTVPAGRDVAAAVTAGIRDRAMCVYSSTEVDVVIDLQSVHRDTHLVLPVSPQRLLDTRVTGAVPSTGIDLDAVLSDVPAATAVVLNVAAVDPAFAGYVVVYACTLPAVPFVSNLNFTPRTTVSNRALVPLHLGRQLCVHTSAPVHLVLDVEAWVV